MTDHNHDHNHAGPHVRQHDYGTERNASRDLIDALHGIRDALTQPQPVDIAGDRAILQGGEQISRAGWSVAFHEHSGVWVNGPDDEPEMLHLGADPDALAELGRFLLDAAAALTQSGYFDE